MSEMANPSKTTVVGDEPVSATAPEAKPTLDELEAAEHAEAMADKAAREAKHPAAWPDAAREDALAPRVDAPKRRPKPASGARTYRVWPHGTFERDGATHKPGATLDLTEEQAAGIGCLELVE